jgi:hypothetical protein
VHCEERERLANIYLAAVAENNNAASAMAIAFRDGWADGWRKDMKHIHAACQAAFSQSFPRHRSSQDRKPWAETEMIPRWWSSSTVTVLFSHSVPLG